MGSFDLTSVGQEATRLFSIGLGGKQAAVRRFQIPWSNLSGNPIVNIEGDLGLDILAAKEPANIIQGKLPTGLACI